MVLEDIGVVLSIVSLIILTVVLRLLLGTPSVSIERAVRQIEHSRRELRTILASLVTLEERTKTIPQLTTMIAAVDEKTSAIPASVSLIGKVEERTRAVADKTARIPSVEAKVQQLEERTRAVADKTARIHSVEAKLQQLDKIRSTLEDLSGRLKSERGFGSVGEEAVESILSSFPEDSWKSHVALAGGVRVDFVFLLPNGKWLPIDSKTGGSELVVEIAATTQEVEFLEPDDPSREHLKRRIVELRAELDRSVLDQAYEVGEYVKGEDRYVNLVVMAVPDPIFEMVPAKTRGTVISYGAELVPYSLLAPFLNYIRRQNLVNGETRSETLLSSLVRARQSLEAVDDTMKNSLERAASMLGNAIENVKSELALAQDLRDGAASEGAVRLADVRLEPRESSGPPLRVSIPVDAAKVEAGRLPGKEV